MVGWACPEELELNRLFRFLVEQFLRPSTKVDEVSDWNMPQWTFISGPQHCEA